ncbi:MAG: chromosome segregation protein [Planctomycetaceae bacterium]|nr:MAG: chromosome segregation protein [Planctomycetaceae bacterium]
MHDVTIVRSIGRHMAAVTLGNAIRLMCFFLMCCLLSVHAVPALHGAELPVVDYERDIKPLLAQRCTRCHGAEQQQGGLRLDYARGLLTGGDSGPAIVPGNPGASWIMAAVLGTQGATKMPLEGDPLSEKEIELLQGWIAQGAPYPEHEPIPPLKEKRSHHWAFQPLQVQPPPNVVNRDWVRNPVDAFILSRLEAEGLSPSPEAEKYVLLRRVHLDLLGLPPPPELIHEFLKDHASDAYERMVDRLLASPHFGERWARDWLDLARYADSNGYTIDSERSIWPYRDWVIRAFNTNIPFDQFVIEQLAGDLLPAATLEQKIATGFHRNTMINEEGGTDPEQFRVEAVVDRVNTTATVFLGLTLGCCQCHDHKYDPFTQREYYQLLAFFNSSPLDTAVPKLEVPTPEQLVRGDIERRDQIRREISRLEKIVKQKESELLEAQEAWERSLSEEQRLKLPTAVRDALDFPKENRTEEQRKTLLKHFKTTEEGQRVVPELARIRELQDQEPKFVTTLMMQELSRPRETFVMVRGDFLRKGARVDPDVPALLPRLPADEPRNRLTLARWLVSPEHPLTPRVTVNRYWQRLFGRGLVATENDFGVQGEPPTHPELLDWLAHEFVRSGWDVKSFLRLIVTSATYRQSSRHRADLVERDPLNRWLGRQVRLRLEAEMIRDAALTAAGLLTQELYGPPIMPPQPDGVYAFTQVAKKWNTSTGKERFRRGLYIHLWRSSLYPGLTVFDFPEANVTCTRRNRSNTPLQALTLANDRVFVECASALGHVLRTLSTSDDERVRIGFLRCVGREPSSWEAAHLRRFIDQERAAYLEHPELARRLAQYDPLPHEQADLAEQAVWTAVARVLINLDEAITRE